jgi:hypothetical protein
VLALLGPVDGHQDPGVIADLKRPQNPDPHAPSLPSAVPPIVRPPRRRQHPVWSVGSQARYKGFGG